MSNAVIAGHQFQAGMWREYALTWTGRKTSTGVDHLWVERFLHMSRANCLRRAKISLYLSRRAQREPGPTPGAFRRSMKPKR